MKWTGKIIGFLIGWMTGGPFLATLGLLIGHAFDKGLSIDSFIQNPGHQKQTQDVFFKTVFSVMGFMAKSDGRVSEEEIEKARHIMDRMGLMGQQKQEAIHFFTEGKQPDFDINAALSEFRQACHSHKDLLRLFIEIQFQAAHIRGQVSTEKRRILKYICQFLGFTPIDFTIFDQFSRAHQRQQQQRRRYHHQPQEPLRDSYQILGLARQASDQEVKNAYRRLMSQHHPDKLIAKGLPESMIKIATEKTQEIKAAYEQICKARGIK